LHFILYPSSFTLHPLDLRPRLLPTTYYLLFLGQQLRQVHGLDRQSLAVDDSGQVHETPGVVGDQVFRARRRRSLELVLAHGYRDFRKFYRKGPAETAAQLVVLHLDKLDPTNGADELSRLAFDSQLAQEMAGVVIGDAAAETRTHVLHLQHLDQEFRKLKQPASQALHFSQPLGVARKELGIEDPQHGGTRARRRDNVLGV